MSWRSPSRDLSDRHAGRRGYFRHRTGVERWKGLATGVAALLAVGWLAAGFIPTRSDRHERLTHGPLANPHAAWDNQCEACHRAGDFTNPLAAGERWKDLSCQECHGGARHFQNAPADKCESCHHDHQGRTNSLVRLADKSCTDCHRDPANFNRPKAAQHVMDFAASHPEFRSLEKAKNEPRRMNFSHAWHMAPGLTPYPDSYGAMRLSDKTLIPTADRYRRTGQTDDLVRLECSSCHQLDADRKGKAGDPPVFAELSRVPKEAVLPPRAGGAVFLPISFETHCQACHALSVPPAALRESRYKLEALALPHRVPVGELKQLLEAAYTKAATAEDPALLDKPAIARLSVEPAAVAMRADIRGTVARIGETLLREPNRAAGASAAQCVECHLLNDAKTDVIPARIPTIRLTAARFDHFAHRASKCIDCHPGAYRPLDAKSDYEHEPLNILHGKEGLDSCRNCHAPKTSQGGGIRHGCTDCHKYHNGEHPLQGRAGAGNDPFRPKFQGFADFLRGTPPP